MKVRIETWLLFIFIFLVSACGRNVYQIDPSFQPFVDSFLKDMSTNRPDLNVPANLIVQFGPTPYNDEGECLTAPFTTPTVNISQICWDNYTDLEKTVIIYHELGHCVLGRVHTSVMNGQWPISIMNPVPMRVFGSDHFQLTETAYIQELFQNAPVQLNPNALPLPMP
jgi:hypothetical protein